jgi:hypothetical protein
MTASDFDELRFLFPAYALGEGATWMEAASRWWVNGIWDLAFRDYPLPPGSWVWNGDGG